MADVQKPANPQNHDAPESDWTIDSIDVLAAHHSGDHVLAMYVGVFNDLPGSQMVITVFSGGYAFTGRLVGAATYLDAVADQVDNEAISIPFRAMAAEYRSQTDEDMQMVTTYVHMLDVTVFAGAKRLAELGSWRGRLSLISGWTTERLAPPR